MNRHLVLSCVCGSRGELSLNLTFNDSENKKENSRRARPSRGFVFSWQPVVKSTEAKEPQEEAAEVKGQKKTKNQKLPEKSEADQAGDQISLQNGRGRGKTTPAQKKKRKAPDAETSAEHWVMKRHKLKASKEEEVVKEKRTVFVGNLPISCSKKTLTALFRDEGSIESIRFRSVVREDPLMSRKVAVIQRRIHPKTQSLNAYVVFHDEATVAKALERSERMEIEKDFHIRVDRVTEGPSGASHDHKRSVFVGNLSFEIKELAFRRHFEECGPVDAMRLVRDQNSGLGKGFGYILFEFSGNQQAATKSSNSFKGEMVDPNKKSQKKGQKKKKKPRTKRAVHI
ncbi:RNA-binding protein 34-like [Pseudoliparis swirei]|uniref:RNA-binding protein 34-like n=1 Tax=Pseudoliparis swirei TaxID=2059687 RepID=UPI0024BD8B3F|nr:RNA-binding protein 34-like [Pseudoliparis swirei]